MKTLLSVLIISMLAVPVWAQQIGQRVRVTTASSVMVGTVAEKDLNDLSVNLDQGGMVSIPFQDVTMMERSIGRTDQRNLGLLIGGLGGLLVGGLIENRDYGRCSDAAEATSRYTGYDLGNPCTDNRAKTAALWGFLSGAGGFIVGYYLEKETWEQVAFKASWWDRPVLIRPQARLGYREKGMMLSLATQFSF